MLHGKDVDQFSVQNQSKVPNNLLSRSNHVSNWSRTLNLRLGLEFTNKLKAKVFAPVLRTKPY